MYLLGGFLVLLVKPTADTLAYRSHKSPVPAHTDKNGLQNQYRILPGTCFLDSLKRAKLQKALADGPLYTWLWVRDEPEL